MSHFDTVVGAIREGEVIPFFGAGVNLFGRDEKPNYKPGTYLPSAKELSEYLAVRYGYVPPDENNLSRVSQFASLMRGSQSLYNTLGEVFDGDYPITPLHRLFAQIPKILKGKQYKRPYQLIVTTNYDDVLERAFRDEGEEYDVVTYIATKTNLGSFRHLPPNCKPKDSIVITRPNTYKKLPFSVNGLTLQRPVILKIHGMVERIGNRQDSQPQNPHDSFVITEDDYIGYLAHRDISRLVPLQLQAKLRNSGFLFLGYGLRDWNLRVIMHRLWRDQELRSASWAVQLRADELEKRFWKTHNVDIVESPLETYVGKLREALLR
jgi:hypothetical protein